MRLVLILILACGWMINEISCLHVDGGMDEGKGDDELVILEESSSGSGKKGLEKGAKKVNKNLRKGGINADGEEGDEENIEAEKECPLKDYEYGVSSEETQGNHDSLKGESPNFFHVLGPDNFMDIVRKHSFLLIYFYHPTCDHCQDGMIDKLKNLAHLLEVDIQSSLTDHDKLDHSQYPRVAICDVNAFEGPWNVEDFNNKNKRTFFEQKLPTLFHVPDFKFIMNHTIVWEYVNNPDDYGPDTIDENDFIHQLHQFIWKYWCSETYSHNKVFHLQPSSLSSTEILIQKEPNIIVQPILHPTKESTTVTINTLTIFQLQLGEKAENNYLQIYEQYADVFIHRLDVGFAASIIPHDDDNFDHHDIANLLVWEKESETSSWENIASYSLLEATNDTLIMDRMSQLIVTHTTPPMVWWNTTKDVSRSSWILSLYYQFIVMVFLPSDHSSNTNTPPILQMIQSSVRRLRQQQPSLFMTALIPDTNLRLIQKFGLQDEPLPTILLMPREGIEKNTASNIRIYHLSSEILMSSLSTNGKDSNNNVVLEFFEKIVSTYSSDTSEEEREQIYSQYGYQPRTISYHYANNEEESKDGSSSSSSFMKPYCTPTLKICHVTSQNYVQHVLVDTWNVHTLVYFFSPTCGHCKRFHVTIWKVLANFINKYQLSHIIQLIQMDVSENLIILEKDWYMDTNRKETDDGSFLENIPALLYYPAIDNETVESNQIPKKKVSYAARVLDDDKLGESNLGGANNPFDIIQWMISFGHFNEDELLQHLSLM